MRIYLTRHGQVRPAGFWRPGDSLADAFFNGDPSFPKGEPSISQLGRGQAVLTANELIRRGFRGPIYSSPYIRTMQTAQLIAERTGSPIYPMGFLREFMFSAERGAEFRGSDIETLRGLFPNVAPDAVLPMPWWTSYKDEVAPMRARVAADLKAFLAAQPDDAEFLLIGHGASVYGVVNGLELAIPEGAMGYNCSLTVLDTGTGHTEVFGMGHLPFPMWSNNCHNDLYGIPDAVLQREPLRVMHLSDTRPSAYPYLREILCTVRPHVILHTGNCVLTGDPAEADLSRSLDYLYSVFRECGASDIRIVPGPQDDPEALRRHIPEAALLPSGSRITLAGTDFALSSGGVVPEGAAHYYCLGGERPVFHPQRGTVCAGNGCVQLICPLRRRVWPVPVPVFRLNAGAL